MISFKTVSAIVVATAMITASVTASAHGEKNKNHIDQTHNVSGFDKIEIGGVYELDVRVGGEFSVETSGHDKEAEGMKIYVEGDTLIVKQKKSFMKWSGNQNGITIKISMPKIEGIAIGGVGEGSIRGINADHLQVEIGGVGGLDFSGKCKTLKIKVGGVGELNARDLKCESADVQLAGVGEIDIYASHSVDIQTAGVGEVNVYGNPEHVEKNKSFLSEVNIK